MGQHYVVFSTRLGWMGIVGAEAGLSQIVLPLPLAEAVSASIGTLTKSPILPVEIDDGSLFFGDLPSRLRRYFEGEVITFADKLDFSPASLFQKLVWEKVRTIPYGETRSYGWVAQEIAEPKACRAIGQALARNHLPIVVPCHRVIGAQGNLTGFAGGLKMKQYLLQMETKKVWNLD
jgi:methylated-DNA-[protein]-cysteine S-methyltransferase